MRTRRAGCCVDRECQESPNKCWPDTGKRFDPIVVYRCGGTDKQKDLYKRHTPETLVRIWPGSRSRWGSKSSRTVDRMERYVQ